MATTAWPTEVDRLLRAAGWYRGRQIRDRVAAWRRLLEARGRFVLHSAAEAVLLEFGGLHIGAIGPGINCARSDVHLDPELAWGGWGTEDLLLDQFQEIRGRALFPLGEVHVGHAVLAMAATGEVYELGDEIYARWPTFDAALQGLLLGVRNKIGSSEPG